jgi:hypothetical protein
MKKRPVSITVIAWIFIIVCTVGLFYHLLSAFDHRTVRDGTEFMVVHASEFAFILPIRLLGIVGGVFLLSAKNWARWILVVWMAFHVGISVMHSWSEVLVHAVFLVVLVCFLFAPKASAYFRTAPGERPSNQ